MVCILAMNDRPTGRPLYRFYMLVYEVQSPTPRQMYKTVSIPWPRSLSAPLYLAAEGQTGFHLGFFVWGGRLCAKINCV